jgi:hypothetical protein
VCQRTYLVLFLVNGLCASELLLEICHLSGIVAWNVYCCLKFAIYLPMAFHFIMLFGKMVHLRFCLVKSYGWAYLFSSWMSTYIRPQRCDHSWWFAACLHIWAINDYNMSSSQAKSSSIIWVGYIAGYIWHGSGMPPTAGWVINHALTLVYVHPYIWAGHQSRGPPPSSPQASCRIDACPSLFSPVLLPLPLSYRFSSTDSWNQCLGDSVATTRRPTSFDRSTSYLKRRTCK